MKRERFWVGVLVGMFLFFTVSGFVLADEFIQASDEQKKAEPTIEEEYAKIKDLYSAQQATVTQPQERALFAPVRPVPVRPAGTSRDEGTFRKQVRELGLAKKDVRSLQSQVGRLKNQVRDASDQVHSDIDEIELILNRMEGQKNVGARVLDEAGRGMYYFIFGMGLREDRVLEAARKVQSYEAVRPEDYTRLQDLIRDIETKKQQIAEAKQRCADLEAELHQKVEAVEGMKKPIPLPSVSIETASQRAVEEASFVKQGGSQ